MYDKKSQEAWRDHKPTITKPITVYDLLKARLGREPTNAEKAKECVRIMHTGLIGDSSHA